MNTEAPQPTEPVTTPAESATPPVEDDSLAAHESLNPLDGSTAAPVDEEPAAEEQAAAAPPKRTRHTAQKDLANREDVPRIRELTKRIKELEAQIQSPPVAASREPDRTPPPRAEPRPAAPAASSIGFSDKEPTIEDFASAPDPYAAYVRALAKYDRAKENFEADQARQAEERTKQEAAQQAEWDAQHVTYKSQLPEFVKLHPDYDQKIAEATQAYGEVVPMVAYRALLKSGPASVYHFLTHPDQLAEMHLLFDGKAVTPQSVALATRWLSSRVQTVGNGSAAPTPPVIPGPRPPNPLRTGPMATGDELPGDEDSLAAHEKAFKLRRR